MYDFLGVEIEHARSDLPCPPDHLRGEDLDVQSYVVIERAPRAVFKDQAEARRLSANSSTRK